MQLSPCWGAGGLAQGWITSLDPTRMRGPPPPQGKTLGWYGGHPREGTACDPLTKEEHVYYVSKVYGTNIILKVYLDICLTIPCYV